MKAVVTGMIATYPVGGVAWDYGQYALGLERLGCEVYYLEDTGLPSYTFDPAIGGYVEDCSDGVRFLQESLALLSPSLARRWHFRSVDGQTFGMELSALRDVIAEADLLLNVSGGTLLRDEYRPCRRKIFLDTDPGWNHFVIFPRWDGRPEEVRAQGFRGHDLFFTYAQRLGRADCPLDSYGFRWHPTVPPVVLDCWASEPPGEKWTTVMHWNNYQKPVVHDGVTYGSKELEFGRFEEVSARARAAFEVAVYSPQDNVPRAHWGSLGWSVVDGRTKSATAASYRSYLQGSRGEFSVAKNIYVATRTGWFSCRSVCYLAAGRPAVIQDTGFSELMPTGQGVVAFSSLEEAVRGIENVDKDYAAHQRAARGLAHEYFDAQRVLGLLLERAGLG
jgi:hypothetical protein